MKIYNVAVYGLNDAKELEYIDKIMISRIINSCREIATNQPITIIKSNKDLKELPKYTLVVTKSNLKRRNYIDNFMLDLCVIDYARNFMDSKFIKYTKSCLDKCINANEVNKNLLKLLDKKTRILKMEK